MANLSTLLGAPSEGGGQVLDPLPNIGIWSQYSGSQLTFSVYDSYLGLIHSGYYDTNSEQFSNYSSYGRAEGSVGSSSRGTYWGQSCTNFQSEGHWVLNLPTKNANYAGVHSPVTPKDGYWPYFGTVIGPKGYRQRISLYTSNDTIELWTRGGYSLTESVNVNSQNLINASGRPGNGSYGMISYNSRINRMAFLQGDSNNNYRLHIWTNPNKNLNTDNIGVGGTSLYTFMKEARDGLNGASYFYNDFQWQSSSSTSYDESRYHMRIIMGDNGVVGMVRMTPNNETRHNYVIPNPAGTTPTQGSTAVTQQGLTTSYGIDNGQPYGMRSTITWDNASIACYSPYYYYGAGINMHLVDTYDPTRSFRYQESDSSWGINVVPIGTGDILIRNPGWSNSDGAAAVYVRVLNISGAFQNLRNPTSSSSSTSPGFALSGNDVYLPVDTSYTSTMYPWVIPMGNWMRTG